MTRRIGRKLAAGAGLAVLLAAVAGHGGTVLGAEGTRFVSPGGSDTGDCIAAPCASIQYAVNASNAGDIIRVAEGVYVEDVMINKTVTLQGAGIEVSIISGAIGGNPATVHVAAMDVVVDGFTITRQGNNPTDWNDPGLNTAGVAILGLAARGEVRNSLVIGNRTGIEIDDSNGNFIHNNTIVDNRTGVAFRNQTDHTVLVENFISNNWTIGVLFLDGSGGGGVPVQSAAGSIFSNNSIENNWSAQIVDRQAGGSLPAPGTVNRKNFAGNWLGSIIPAVTSSDTSFELPYADLIPAHYGGTAFPTGAEFDVGGPASANLRLRPLLKDGRDYNVETTPGRGIVGFQGLFLEAIRDGNVARQALGTPPIKDWVLYSSNPSSTGEFRHGPATPPRGVGSLELQTTGPADSVAILNYEHVGTRLSDLDHISYSTYRLSGGPAALPSFRLEINPSGANDGTLATLVYEPVHDHPGELADTTWQVWDAYNEGTALWWSTADLRDSSNTLVACNPNGPLAVEPECAGKVYVPWATIVGALPNALISGGVGINQGGDALASTVDQLTIGVSAYDLIYDFEPKGSQTIEFDVLLDRRLGDDSFPLEGFATSGLPLTYTVEGPCSVEDDFFPPFPGVTLLGLGICTITASQPGNGFFESAPDVVRSFTIKKPLATLVLSNLVQVYDGTPRHATVTTTPVGLAGVSVTYDVLPSAPSDIGTYDVVASLDNPDYEAFEATGTLVILDNRESQAITAPSISSKTTIAPDFAFTASATSGLEVIFAASGPCAVSAAVGAGKNWTTTIAITGAGSCAITMLQAGNAQWAPATATRTFTIAKVNQKITFPTIASRSQSAPPFEVTATSNSGLPITFAAAGQCSLSSPTGTTATVTISGALGTCSITASQPGNADYNAAPSITRTFSITQNIVLASVAVSPTSFPGTCGSVVGKVSLNVKTPTPRTVSLASSSPLVVVPPTVVVPANQKTATFPISASDVSADVRGSVSATLDAITLQGSFTLRAPRIFSLALTPGLVTGGLSSSAIVTLDCKAAAGGVSVVVTSSSTRATVVGSPVLILEGQTTGSVTIDTTLGPLTAATIKATANGATKSAVLTIQP